MLFDVEFADQQLQHGFVDVLFDFEANRRTPGLAAQQLLFEGEQQVFGVVLFDFDILIAGHAEGAVGDDLHAGEELIQMSGDHLLQRNEPPVAQRHEPAQHIGDFHPCELGDATHRIADQHGEVHAQAGDVGERVGWIHRERGEYREDAGLE